MDPSSTKLIKTWDANELRKRCLKAFGFDIDYLLEGNAIRLVEQQETGFQRFEGCKPGDGAFYNALSRLPWYYRPHKWEHDFAAQYANENYRKDATVFDVGCGGGEFLERVRAAGFTSAYGSEFNENALSICRGKQLDVQPKWMHELIAEGKQFNLLTAFQVLEHVTDPVQFISEIRQLLTDDGVAIISTPNRNSFTRRFAWDLLDMPPHHLWRWNAEAYRKLAERTQLDIERIILEPLAPYHLTWCVSSLFQWLPEWKNLPWKVARLLTLVPYPEFIRNKIAGHTILVVLRKRSSSTP